MYPLIYTWAGLLFWIALAWALLGELPFLRREHNVETAVTDRGSKGLIHITTGISVVIASFVAATLRDYAIASFRLPVYLSGVACIVAGGWLRRHCFRMLGESFTYDVRVASDQRVVERGAYKCVRHPSYAAGMLIFGGVGLAQGNWLSLAILVILPALAFAYRISVEERALLATLGPAYAGYMKRTTRLIPFVM